ncbi:MAG: zinc-ribbon and DUF3426 domain-containing protein [Halopseudomonas sp.]|uniref:zinc-ribbon and DUF3426 domain-containing protein n=1 Tax=Halopseudomonas sp. TaxID=2901191 RepID=UPI003002B7AC
MSELQVTQCPYCKTHFRLSQEQLSAAAGNVRCGACLKVFNALGAAASSPPANAATPIERHNAAGELLIHDDLELDDLDLEALGLDESLVEEVNPPLSATRTDDQNPPASSTEPLSATALVGGDLFHDDDPPFSLAETAQQQEEEYLPYLGPPEDDDSLDLHDDFIATPPARDLAQRPTIEPPSVQPSEATTEKKPPPARLLPLQDDVRANGIFLRDRPAADTIIDAEPLDTGLSARREAPEVEPLADEETAPHDDGRSEPRLDGELSLPELEEEPLLLDEVGGPTRHSRRSWLWTPLCVLAALALAVQAVTYNLDAWARDARWRPMLESICLVAGCELPVRVDIGQLRSSNLLVRPHPEFPNAVAIDVIIYNRADYPQPFPVVRMTFSDTQGESVSEKRFRPEEYLGGELAGRDLMPPQTPIHIALSMLAPGPRATSYNLDFLSP